MREAWRNLRSDHTELIDDVANARRFMWLGSGISWGIAPDLSELIARVLRFLRDRAITTAPDATEHEEALLEIIDSFLPQERPRYLADRAGWEPPNLESLRDQYSRVLGVGVRGKPNDYLLIDGAGLPELYGDPGLRPGSAHELLAMLIFEGCATHLASGNWDGLVEKALREISSIDTLLSVYVDVNDPRDSDGDAEIAKFHGCAVLADVNPERYRSKIIATTAQISKLHADPEFDHMTERLRDLATRMRSLVLGLSVQDSDLLAVFQGAASRSPWGWDPEHPAYLFAEPSLQMGQRDVLEVAYGDDFGRDRAHIARRSVLGSYAGPVLAALVVEVLALKMTAALERHHSLPSDVVSSLQQGLRRIVLRVVAGHGRDEASMTAFLLSGYSDFLRTYMGPATVGAARYIPFARGTKTHVERDMTVMGMGVDLLAVTLGLIGLGELSGRWRASLLENSIGSRISLARPRTTSRTTVVVVRGAAEAIAVMASDDWIQGAGDIALLQMQIGAASPTRSPGGRLGRRRAPRSRRDVRWSELVDSVTDADELMARFETGVGL